MADKHMDQCMHCIVKDNAHKCDETECTYHHLTLVKILRSEIKELKEEIKELKEEIKRLNRTCDLVEMQRDRLLEENEE